MTTAPSATAAPAQLSPEKILNVGFGYAPSKVLLSAIGFGLFTLLAERGSATLDDVQSALGLHARGTRDFLDTLVSLGFLEREDGRYRNAPDADFFLDRRKPSYVGGILEMANTRLYGYWGTLEDALRTGLPQNEYKQGTGSPFEKLYSDPDRLKLFLGAMTGISIGAGMALAAKFPWSDYQTFADIGCAQGAVPVQIARANPHLRGIGWDLPQVKPIFEEYVRANGLEDRVTFQAGDFFTDPLPSVDVLVMGHILHDWGMDDKRMLIRKSYEALPSGGALVLHEALIDDDRRQNVFGLIMSLNMLIETPAGFDYTGADAREWLTEAGFREVRVEHLAGPDSMVVAVK